MEKVLDKPADQPTLVHPVAGPALPAEVRTDTRPYSRFGWGVMLASMAGFLLWALLAPLDQGVPVSGTVVVASKRKAVQHETGGTIKEILVKEGDRVQAGQVLVRLQNETLASQVETSRMQLLAARATEARLTAERDGMKAIAYPPDLAAARTDPHSANYLAVQEQLFSSRRLALQNELGAIDENIAGLRMQIQGLAESRDNKKRQLALLAEQLDGMRDLAKEGYVPRNRVLELERMHAQLAGGVAEDVGNIGRAQRQVLEMGMRRVQRQQEYQKEVRQQLTDLQDQETVLVNRLHSQGVELQNLEVKAPVDGAIVGMNVFTQGGVIGAGFRMMDVVPSDDPLIIEGQLPVHLVDKVKPGLPVDLHFSALNQNRTPQIKGVVADVSADRLVDEKTNLPYYKISARVGPDEIKKVAGLGIQAGMPVDIFVRTGERTLMNYLLKPLTDRAHTALTEE